MYPALLKKLHFIIRDFRGQNIAVHPFAYNPVTKTLRVVDTKGQAYYGKLVVR